MPPTGDKTITRSELALLILQNEVEMESVKRDEVEWWMFQGVLFHWVESESGAMWEEVKIIE